MIRQMGKILNLIFFKSFFGGLPILFVLISATPLWSFSVLGSSAHQDITEIALSNGGLNPFQATLSDGSQLAFSNRAFQEIFIANVKTDANQGNKKLHFDDEKLVEGSLYLINQKNIYIAGRLKAVGSARHGAEASEARRLLGTALHTIQDYYAHTTYLDLQQATGQTPSIDNRLGKTVLPKPSGSISTCEDDLETFITSSNTLTSGYFTNVLSCPDIEKPGQKCAHGTFFGCSGINKDHSGRPGFTVASQLAIKATEDYVEQVLQQLSGNDEAIKLLMVGEDDIFRLDPARPFTTSINRDEPPGLNETSYFIENNLEQSTVHYSISSNVTWLNFFPSESGSLDEDENREIRVRVNGNATLLDPGTYTATVQFSGADTLLERTIQLNVIGDPAPGPGPLPVPVE